MHERDDMTTREMLSELRRDVKWICLTLQEIKESLNDHESRLRSLESFRSEEIGNRIRGSRGAGGLVAVILRWLGGG